MKLLIVDFRLQIDFGLLIGRSPQGSRTSRRRVSSARAAISAVIVLLLTVTAARASELGDDLAARRARVMDRLGPEAILILWSAPTARYSNDVDYKYRQDSNLYYLTGVTQPDTMLILMPGNETRREILFVKDRNPAQEQWTGPLLSAEEARRETGIGIVLPSSQFEPFAAAMLGGRGSGAVSGKEAARFFDALSAGRARVGLVLDPNRGVNDPLTPPLEFARRIRDRFVGFAVTDAAKILSELRLVKTPYERKVLTKSFEISNEAQLAGMRAARPGAYEYEVKAAIEAVHYGRGAAPGYPSIVGSGPNATILHYPGGARQMQAGELLLVDAACSLDYLTGDITRTYPTSGTFSPGQRDIYAIVLQAQLEGIQAARPGVSILDIHRRTVEVIKTGLLKLGLITDVSGEQYRIWYTHGASHYIGIDVHDVGDGDHPLEAGMAFTIEPGIYIRQGALDSLPRTPENIAFIEKVQPAVRKYADIGVRIEDSFLLDASGLRNLSGALPKTIDDIEALMRGRSR
jgi:Xaa-Pro aminopeptidase